MTGFSDSRLRHALPDAAFVVFVVTLSVLPYVGGLGFYSDDWAFLGMLRNGDDQSLPGLIGLQYEGNPNLELRPTQVVFQALLYDAFGLQPLGYHVVNTAVFAALGVLFLLVLRELGVPRLVALSIPTVYVLLPHYSTNRFWFASFGYALSIALFFLSLFADLRSARSTGRGLVAWKTLALAALVAAAFGYEVVLPLLLVVPVVSEWHARRVGRRRTPLATAAFHAPGLVLLAVAVAYKATTTSGGLAGAADYYLRQLFFGSLTMSFVSYGLALPEAVWWSLRELDAAALICGAVLTVAAAVYLARVAREPGDLPPTSWWARAALVGLIVFALGYAIFLTTVRILFTSTGIANRSTMAGTLGVAIVFVAAIGLATRLLPPRLRTTSFVAAMTALCGAGFAVNNAIGGLWVDAWREEERVLRQIRTAIPRPEPRTTVLLEGVCPYRGPAIVFESNWDLEGALRAHYRDPTLEADTAETVLTAGPRGVSTLLYGVIGAFYPYSERLLLFDANSGTLEPLRDRAAFLTARPGASVECPHGDAGKGVTIFSTDRLYQRLETRGFRLLP